MRAIEAARCRLIDRIDRVARIEETAGNGSRIRIVRQRTIHQSRAEKASDEAVVRGLPRRVELTEAQDGDGKPLCAVGKPQGFQTREKSPRLALRQGLILLRGLRMRRKHRIIGEQEHAPHL